MIRRTNVNDGIVSKLIIQLFHCYLQQKISLGHFQFDSRLCAIQVENKFTYANSTGYAFLVSVQGKSYQETGRLWASSTISLI